MSDGGRIPKPTGVEAPKPADVEADASYVPNASSRGGVDVAAERRTAAEEARFRMTDGREGVSPMWRVKAQARSAFAQITAR